MKSDKKNEKLEKLLRGGFSVNELTEEQRKLIINSRKGDVGQAYEPGRAAMKLELSNTASTPEYKSAGASVTGSVVMAGYAQMKRAIKASANMSESKAAERKRAHVKDTEKKIKPVVERLIRAHPYIKDAAIVRELLKINPNGMPVYGWLKTIDGGNFSTSGLRPYVKRLADEMRKR